MLHRRIAHSQHYSSKRSITWQEDEGGRERETGRERRLTTDDKEHMESKRRALEDRTPEG